MTIGTSSVPTACLCCVAAAAMLTKSGTAAAVEQPSRQMAEQSFLSVYTPSTNVDDIASLDLDLRSIVARLAKDSETGLTEAKDIYTNGRTGGFIGATVTNDMTIKS